jgi:murein L,D-transpeptidase YcbB/YkuD
MGLRTGCVLALAIGVAACANDPVPIEQATVIAAPAISAFSASLEALDLRETWPKTGKAILVNVPGYELIALEDGEPVLRSRVIVGSTRNPTPIMETYTSVVRFRPTWRPTPSMIASGEYEDYVRRPGRNNPLGLAAVRLEPGMLIYLHDTNRRDLFDRERRAMSHGCIRVERWDEVIAWLLEIDLAEVEMQANSGRTHDVALPPIPVLVRYHTAFPDDEGRIVQHDDVYRRGARPL